MASSRGVFGFLRAAQAQQDGQAAVDPQVELAQARQRDEVHALNQLARFRSQILAGVALQRLLQIVGVADLWAWAAFSVPSPAASAAAPH